MNFTAEKFANWNKGLVEASAIVGSDEFAPALIQSLKQLVDFDLCMIFAYGEDSGSVALHHNIYDDREKLLIDDYLGGPHLLDPFYEAAISGRKSGFGAMRDLAPDQFYRSEFYRHHYIRTGIADEIGVFFPVKGNRVAVLSITRQKPKRIFSEAEKSLFAAASAVIEAFGAKHWGEHIGETQSSSRVSSVQAVFDSFGEDVLTQREREIITLVLKGHSSVSIGHVLNISAGTVKIHRKNAYSKMEVVSQAELFSRFLSLLQKRLGS